MAGRTDPPIAIIGPGGVGGLLAALLAHRGYPVVCVARAATAAQINEKGLQLTSKAFGNMRVQVQAVERLKVQPLVALFTTKLYSLSAAMTMVEPAILGGAPVVPLLNGMEHYQTMRAVYGTALAAGNIGKLESYRESPTHIVHTTAGGLVEMATAQAVLAGPINHLAELLRSCGLDVEVKNSEAAVIWAKLVRMGPVASVTAASGLAVGAALLDSGWRRLMEDAADEAAAVARAEGFSITSATVMAQIASLPSTLQTSLQRDVARGEVGEMDAFAGGIVRAGGRHNISCPTFEKLMAIIQSRIDG